MQLYTRIQLAKPTVSADTCRQCVSTPNMLKDRIHVDSTCLQDTAPQLSTLSVDSTGAVHTRCGQLKSCIRLLSTDTAVSMRLTDSVLFLFLTLSLASFPDYAFCIRPL